MGSQSARAERCAGCGKKLRGRRRKWCTDTCRRNTLYGGRCETCGKTTSGNNGRAKAPRHCRQHSDAPRQAAARAEREHHDKRELIVSMVRAMRSDEDIAQTLGTTVGTVGSAIHRLRNYGYEMPYRGRPLPDPHPWRRQLD